VRAHRPYVADILELHRVYTVRTEGSSTVSLSVKVGVKYVDDLSKCPNFSL